jgi:pimeloyl-ACP methyl ester carboxylesterase
MIAPYNEHLVHTHSEDGFRLDGVLITPTAQATKPLAIVCVSGLYSAFYDSPYPELGRAIAARGFSFVSGNHRGHDFGAVLRRHSGEIVPGGGGWERLAEAPLDIGGWISFLLAEGFNAVALLGHSMGARKAAYYQAQRQDERVAALIAASPFAGSPPPPDPVILALAEQMVAEGRGRDLLPWPNVGCSMSAATYLEQSVPEATFLNIYASITGEAPIAQVRCPMLVFYGADERGPDSPDRSAELETIRRNAVVARHVETAMIKNAGHMYQGHEAEVAALIVNFLDAVSSLS